MDLLFKVIFGFLGLYSINCGKILWFIACAAAFYAVDRIYKKKWARERAAIIARAKADEKAREEQRIREEERRKALETDEDRERERKRRERYVKCQNKLFLTFEDCKSGSDKGSLMERSIVKRLIQDGYLSSEYVMNAYLPAKNEIGYTEVDAIMVGPNGLYVFESKNRSGTIIGDEEEKNWTQHLGGGRTPIVNPLYNPVWQNDGHCLALKNVLKDTPYKDVPIWSVIVFASGTDLSKVTVRRNDVRIVTANRLSDCMRRLCPHDADGDVTNTIDVEGLYSILRSYTNPPEGVKEKFKELERNNGVWSPENMKRRYAC